MGGNIVGSGDNDKPGQVAHDVEEVRFTTVVGNVTRGPQINMKNIERAAERPGEYELTVTGHGTVGGNALRASEDPGSDVLPTERPEKSEADAV